MKAAFKKRVSCRLTSRESAAVLRQSPSTSPRRQKLRVAITSFGNALRKINLSLLRIDLKQNLLVWPNIAGDLTRSPPPSPSFA
jgi:hypothetical protein